MSPDGWAYYAREIAEGAEDYFAGHGEEPGRWVGRGAASLGLAGQASAEQLGVLFGQGCDPASGSPLGRRQPGGEAVAGWALSFSPPKSVSVLWALAAPAVAEQVRAGHDAAVGAALEFLEAHAGFTRRGRAGVVQADTDGYVGAVFVHRTSRAGDPQLHTHLLVANKVRASSDGAWLSLDGRELFESQRAAGMVYKAALRDELTARIGVGWEPVGADGGGEIVGVPAAVIASFSTRRRQVEAAAGALLAARQAELGRSLTGGERAELFQLAAYRSRAAKAHGERSTAQLRAGWRQTALEVAGDPGSWLAAALTAAAGPGEVSGPAPLEAVGVLETARSTWGRADVVETVSTLLTPAGRPARQARAVIEAAADAVLADAQVVSLCFPSQPEAPAGVLRRRDGLDPTVRHGQARYSTWRTLATEQAILDIAEVGRSAEVAVCPPEVVAAAVARAGLSDDQAAAVGRLCGAGERVGMLVGPAGSGKSRCLAAARDAWEATGAHVIGVAPSAVAAGVLAEQAGIRADTLARWLAESQRRRHPGIGPGDVIVCDEASMVATNDLAALARAAETAGAKLVLVGDHRQLGAVEAGGLFRLLVADHHAAQLTGAHRFHHAWEAAASHLLRDGDPAALEAYDTHGRITAAEAMDVLEVAFAAWHDARGAGATIVITAPDHDTVDAIANRIHDQRVAAGEVHPDGIAVAGQTISVGDEIVTTRNDRRLVTTTGGWVRNGDRWTLQTLRADGTATLTSLDGRGRVRVPADYLASHVALAYAVTVHKAQGLTVDRAVTIVNERSTLEHLYVGMTRGRHTNHAVVTATSDDDHTATRTPDPAATLAKVLTRSGNELSATETLRNALDTARLDPRRLRAAILEARRAIDAAAGPDQHRTIAYLAEQARTEPTAAQQLLDAYARLQQARDNLQQLRTTPPPAPPPAQPRPWWRRKTTPAPPAPPAVDTDRIQRAETATAAATAAVTAAEQRLHTARTASQHLTDARAAQARRHQWLAAHPDTVNHVRDLTALLTTLERRAQQPAPGRRPAVNLAPPEPAHTPTI